MLKEALLRRATAALNRGMQDSTRARDICAQLEGRSLQVAVSGSPWTGTLLAQGGTLGLRVEDHATAAPADVTLRGSAAALLGALGSDQRSLLHSGALQLDGDAQLAQYFDELLRCLRPDLEHELSRWAGPLPAHLLASSVRRLWQRAHSLWNDQSRNAADYLAHERGALVSVPEAEHRYRQIEAARENLDRLEARLGQAELQGSSEASPPRGAQP
jgi:ubiquinone biosynthesis protein UbiJ